VLYEKHWSGSWTRLSPAFHPGGMPNLYDDGRVDQAQVQDFSGKVFKWNWVLE